MSQLASLTTEPRQVIGDDRSTDRVLDDLGDDDLLELYRWLVLLRVYDERSVLLHRQGRIGTYAIFWNHEAIQAGSAFALGADDWLFPTYRESAIGLLRGIPASTLFSWWRGHPDGWWNPLAYNVASIAVPIASQVPHAVGLAWGKQMRGESSVAAVYFGDGATSEGAFHEGANFAGVMNAPVILICNNNGWAISTPVAAQTKATTLADKAIGYGIPAVRVDGLDVLAVYEATREAALRARGGDGPSFIEAIHYRAAPHGTADDHVSYIDLEKVADAREHECVARYERYLIRHSVLSGSKTSEIREEATEVMRAGIKAAESASPPDPAEIFDHALVEPLPSYSDDLSQLRQVLER